ncbi:PREDICTED: UPF0538 protein C2orf76 homolog [Acropora digitifera]|uniref:UPF0538 protein C2orf76 homolog n=1 Tax=Acropora digitifera TaxID=70779 RepID=UPI00077A22AB|nr:PREDICTED: UPF0538 protein C2orf76 homolog [Acropora digitifera]
MVDSGYASVTITVRLIRSFEHRNIKHVVYKKVPLHQTVEQFMRNVVTDIKKRTDIPPPFRIFGYDTMKIQHKAYGAKVLLFHRVKCSFFSPTENETEISFFKIADYRKYQADPVMKWY